MFTLAALHKQVVNRKSVHQITNYDDTHQKLSTSYLSALNDGQVIHPIEPRPHGRPQAYITAIQYMSMDGLHNPLSCHSLQLTQGSSCQQSRQSCLHLQPLQESNLFDA